MPWDDYSEHSSSPVQNALSSCIAHFENLIQTRQPDEDQMEYIVGQFEAMASFLSAPEAQTKTTDEHLFSDPEHGLGNTSAEDSQRADEDLAAKSAQVNQEYVAEVGRYIDGVKKYIEDLKMRLDEVKTLNSIQLDVIYDLRRQMRTVRQGMRSSLSMREDYQKAEEQLSQLDDPQTDNESAHGEHVPKQFGLESWETIHEPLLSPSDCEHTTREIGTQTPPDYNLTCTPRRRVITIIRKPETRSFWSSFAEALDQFGDLLLEQ